MILNVYLIGDGFEAKGIYNSMTNEIKILKGSTIKIFAQPSFLTTTNSTVTKRREMRNYLINDTSIIKDYVFQKDYLLGTPSFCYGVLAGKRGTAGRKTWLLNDGNPLVSQDKD